MKLLIVWVSIIIFPIPNKARNTTYNIISEVVQRIFGDILVCVIYNPSSIDNLINKALSTSKIPLVSFSSEYWMVSETRGTCSAYLVPLDEEFNLGLIEKFSPWSKIVFVYCSSTVQSRFFSAIIENYPLKVFLVELKSCCLKTRGLKPHGRTGITVKYLNQNQTLLALDTDTSSLANWTNRPLKKWHPNFEKGRSFRISLQHCPPYIYLKNDTMAEGIEARIIEATTKNWPVEYILEGPEVRNGWWGKTEALIERGERDLGVCAHWQTNALRRKLDLTHPHTTIYNTFVVRRPQLLSDVGFVFRIFQLEVYATTAVAIVLMASLLSLFNRAQGFSNCRNNNSSFSDMVMCLLRLFTAGCMSTTRVFRFSSSRLLIINWILFCQWYANYNSAGITSLLTKPPPSQTINTIEDMAKYNVRWSLHSDLIRDQFLSVASPVNKKMAELFRRGKTMREAHASATFVKTLQKQVYDVDDYLSREEWRHYKLLKEGFVSYGAGFVLTKHSPFTKAFSQTTLRFVESGIIDCIIGNYFSKERKYQEALRADYEEGYVHSNIDLSNLQGAFLLLVSGLGLGLLVFVFELLW